MYIVQIGSSCALDLSIGREWWAFSSSFLVRGCPFDVLVSPCALVCSVFRMLFESTSHWHSGRYIRSLIHPYPEQHPLCVQEYNKYAVERKKSLSFRHWSRDYIQREQEFSIDYSISGWSAVFSSIWPPAVYRLFWISLGSCILILAVTILIGCIQSKTKDTSDTAIPYHVIIGCASCNYRERGPGL